MKSEKTLENVRPEWDDLDAPRPPNGKLVGEYWRAAEKKREIAEIRLQILNAKIQMVTLKAALRKARAEMREFKRAFETQGILKKVEGEYEC